MKKNRCGSATTAFLGHMATFLLGWILGNVAMQIMAARSAREFRIMATKEHAIVFTTGLCAVDGPLGAARYCADWTWIHTVEPYFYRCGLAIVDSKQSIRHLRVAQFSTKQEAVAGTHQLNAVSCDTEKRVRTDNDPKEWEISTLPAWIDSTSEE